MAATWERAGLGAGLGAGAGARGGGGGGGGGRAGGGIEAERQMREDRLSAGAIGSEFVQANRAGADEYGGYDEANRLNNRYDTGQELNAEAENRNRDQVAKVERDKRAATIGGLTGAASHVGGIFKGMGPIGGALGAFSAEKNAMLEDRALTESLQEMGYSPTDPGFPALMEQLRTTVQASTSNSIYSDVRGSLAMPGTAGQFGAVFATPEERLSKYQAILPAAMRFAEVSEQYGRGDLRTSLRAGINYSHMTGRYEEKPLESGLDHLLALALATGDTVAAEQGILKYSVPLGRAAGVDPDDIAALTGFFQVMGFTGTTAGTGVGQLLMGLTTTGGPVAAHLRSPQQKELERTFESALHLGPAKELHAVRESRGDKHGAALHELGFTDGAGKPVEGLEPGGKLNEKKFISILETGLGAHTPMEDLELLRNAFTVRGSREAALLSDPATVGKLTTFLENMTHPQSARTMQAELQTRPLQQWEQMLANLSNVGNTLATTTLPGLNTMIVGINGLLVGVNEFLKQHQTIATGAAWAALAAAGAWATGIIGKGVGGLWRGTLAPAARAASSLIPGVGEGALMDASIGGGSGSVMGMPLLGPLGVLGGAVLGGGLLAGKAGAPMVDDYGRPVGNWGGPRAAGAPPPANITINMGGLSISGLFDAAMKSTILSWITSAFTTANANAGGQVQGSHESPYTGMAGMGF